MKKTHIKSRDIALGGMFFGLIMLFVFVPINILGIDIAFIPLIAIFIAAQVEGLYMGLFAGASFGFASLLAAFVRPTVFSPMFYNPLVSIVPRIIIPVTTYFSFVLVKKLLRRRSEDASTYVASTVSAIVGVVTNTALVVSMLAAFNFGKVYGGTKIGTAFLLSLLGVNFVIELCCSAIITPIVVTALRIALKIDKKGKKKSLPQKKECADNEECGN